MESAQESRPSQSKQTRISLSQLLLWAAGLIAILGLHSSLEAQQIILAWDASLSPGVAGYFVRYGIDSRQYDHALDAGPATTATVTGLNAGFTYYFAATAYTTNGVESDPSEELSFTVPGGVENTNSPTLNPLSNLTINEDAAMQTINLRGISGGLGGILSPGLEVTASSSNPALIPHPSVTYSSPAATGTIRLAPVANASGTVTITVTVNNFQPLNNLLSRSFTVAVNPVNDTPTLNALNDLSLDVNSGQQTVALNGISSGAPNESQPLAVTSFSSDPALLPNPTVSYASGSNTGTLSFTPVPGAAGTAIITVIVSDGQSQNNAVSRSFVVSIGTSSPNQLYLEAESGTVASPMVVATDPEASNGRYIYSQRSEQGTVTIGFDVERTDSYIVWCRVLSQDSSTDSFYVSIDGGPEEIYRTAVNRWSSQWQWTRINDETAANPRRFTLGEGPHILTFRGRESSTRLDAVYVTNDPEFVPLRLSVAPVSNPVRAMQISFQSSPGYRYQLQATEDFRSWTTIWSAPLAAGNEPFSFVDPLSATARVRSYRVRIDSTNLIEGLPSALPLNLAIAAVANPVRGMRISFQSTSGHQYQVQATEDFQTWTTIWNSPVAIANDLLSMVDTASTASKKRFYRVLVNPAGQFASASTPARMLIATEVCSSRSSGISFQSLTGSHYQLQATEDLRSWTPLWTSPLASNNQLLSFADTAQTAARSRIDRLQVNN